MPLPLLAANWTTPHDHEAVARRARGVRVRRVLLAWGALGLALLAVPPTGVAQAADKTCDSKAATIVGDGSRARIIGTDGPDVIVSRNAAWVDARGGDDTICVTGVVGRDDRSEKVFDGPGDDLVINQATYVNHEPGATGTVLQIFLVEGDDRFVGNDTPEFVVGRSGNDTIETNGGADSVMVGSQEYGGPERPAFAGQVDVGDGGSVTVGPDVGPEATFTTDDPAEYGILFGDGSDPSSAWSIDVAAGEVSRDGVLRFRFEGFRRFASFRDVDAFFGTPGG